MLKTNQNGIALMIVLWVLVLLSALATEFAFSMRTEVNSIRNYKEDVETYYLAKAGIQLAFAELLEEARFHSVHPEHGFITGIPTETDTKPEELLEEDILNNDFKIITRTNIPLGNGTISYKISDENGRVNINAANREILIKVLSTAGMEIGEPQDIVADSILDWIDKDDNHRLNGAESDYYNNQVPPYKAKNDFFDSLDELLKVRGITPELLYGTNNKGISNNGIQYISRGLIDLLTVQNIQSFNPNTANFQALSIYYAEDKIEEIRQLKTEQGYYDNSLSSHFRIESTGKINNSPTKHTIKVIVQKFGLDNKATLLIRYWKDNAV